MGEINGGRRFSSGAWSARFAPSIRTGTGALALLALVSIWAIAFAPIRSSHRRPRIARQDVTASDAHEPIAASPARAAARRPPPAQTTRAKLDAPPRSRPVLTTHVQEEEFPPFLGMEDGLSSSDFETFIRQTDDTRFEISRSFIEAVFSASGAAIGRNVVGPSEGEASGLRVQHGKVAWLEHLGIEDGDILVAVNGAPLDSWQQLAGNYAATGSAPMTTLTLIRDGEDVTLQHILRN